MSCSIYWNPWHAIRRTDARIEQCSPVTTKCLLLASRSTTVEQVTLIFVFQQDTGADELRGATQDL